MRSSIFAAWKDYIDEKGTVFSARATREQDDSKRTCTNKCTNMHWTVIDTWDGSTSWY